MRLPLVKGAFGEGGEGIVKMRINGEEVLFNPPPGSLADLLSALAVPQARIAVERNGRIIPRAERESCPVAEGDAIEIVTLVGGG